jgi:hypothetical protein
VVSGVIDTAHHCSFSTKLKKNSITELFAKMLKNRMVSGPQNRRFQSRISRRVRKTRGWKSRDTVLLNASIRQKWVFRAGRHIALILWRGDQTAGRNQLIVSGMPTFSGPLAWLHTFIDCMHNWLQRTAQLRILFGWRHLAGPSYQRNRLYIESPHVLISSLLNRQF